jgi:phenylalanyl-tRNA synthetase alpha chain
VQELTELLEQVRAQIAAAADLAALDAVRVRVLGKKGVLTDQLKTLGALPPEERRAAGARINAAKDAIEAALAARRPELAVALDAELAQKRSMLTFPAAVRRLARCIRDARSARSAHLPRHGLRCRARSRDRRRFHNFEALNIPSHHPARAEHAPSIRRAACSCAHASNVRSAPCAPASRRSVHRPGRLSHDSDVTHTPMFHQIEGFVVDEGISLANLKAVLHQFVQTFFERELGLRFRASYFPFTEPSAEVDMQCVMCGGGGRECRICGGTGWLEVAGSGVVHPQVFRNVGIDPERYTGYAFGMGVERLAMLRYQVNDLRLFFENDLRFLEQFR